MILASRATRMRTMVLQMVGPTLAHINNHRLMRITHLGLEFAPKLPSQAHGGPPSPTTTLWTRLVHLLNHTLHRGTLTFKLMHPRPHAIHVKAKHLIISHRHLPRVAFLPRCRCRNRSGDGMAQLNLLEEEHLNHRSQRESLRACMPPVSTSQNPTLRKSSPSPLLKPADIDGTIEAVVEESRLIWKRDSEIVELSWLEIRIGSNLGKITVDEFPYQNKRRRFCADYGNVFFFEATQEVT
ncbi:hypothetical protein Lal_00026411 [Lupinus albus]|nr:hypothetical protein Lal_00026411 [Lupinus albus]